ncbi:hypothetical protein EUX98_g9498 [Antrodiella citrinella]|uniref:DNA 3'-5' helicase n=1 Tax=Antrodiella citrinella TaxID=2447956 RepID=A0A4S4LT80_9APHY|nr:hypothetical protein EUX98_g9498 [Antrodiella citrinella]
MPLQFSPDSIVIIVSALNVLGDQFVDEATKAGFSAISVNADNDNDATFKAIKERKYRVIVMSPNIITKRGGRCQNVLWKDAKFVAKLQNLIFDEGHCIIQWGNSFRPEYKDVSDVVWQLPDIPIYVSSATIPPLMISELKTKFRLTDKNVVVFQCSNDRPNINLVVRRIKHPQNSYEDLGFLVPKDWKEGDPMPKKFIAFFDSKKEAEDASKFLMSRVSLALRKKVPWFHAGMTKHFRADEIDNLKTGETWGICATDSGGMGLDIADILIVVQWKVPIDLNTLIQRIGRAVRDQELEGIAILLAESSAFYEGLLDKEVRKRKAAEDKEGPPKKKRKAASAANATAGPSQHPAGPMPPDSDVPTTPRRSPRHKLSKPSSTASTGRIDTQSTVMRPTARWYRIRP